nr:contactin-3-like [Biomphalaria glabrata]
MKRMFYTVKRLVSLLLLFLRFRPSDQTQSIEDCPPSWFHSSGLCYNFVFQPEKTYQEALLHCQQDMAQLVSIKTAGQHEFIQTWLKTHDAAGRDWFTSGIKERSGHFVWNSDGSNVTDTYFGDHELVDKIKIDIWTRLENNVVVYKYFATVDQYMWGWNRVMKPGAFICQIEQAETWRFYQQQRDFSYGSTSSNPTAWEFAPNITYISQDTIFFETRGQTTDVTLECLASGNPIPQYRWFRKSLSRGVQEWMDPQINSKITLSYGKLIIRNPDPVTDSSTYTCVASNKLGTVWSNPVDVGFGYIGQFSNVKTNFIDAVLYMGIEIGCDTPVHNTDLHYAWYKSDMNFIRPELNSQYFLSKNGKFYISEVQSSDQGEYFCVVMMVPRSGQVLTETQAPSRTSLGIDLRVLGGTAHTYGPEIMDKFPQFFPEVPMVGDYVELECFAYGRMPLYYSWLREDGPLHPQAFYRDYKRVLVIPKARLQDTGSYTCIVKGDKNSSNKTLHLSLKSRPYFPYPMRNQHLDAGMSFTWTCGAIGYPLPTYTWYKNGVRLTSDSGDGIKVHRNTLTISNVTLGRHEGVYQCEAVNAYGKARSGGQLRILYFAPTFATSAIETSKSAAEGGNVTIACSPHAAPRATIKWLRNGAEVGHFLPNGALELSSLKKSDEGVYTCVASNELGEASSTCRLFVEENAVFVEQPIDVTVEENETTVIPCKVSFVPGKMDIVYSWRFYSHVIDFTSISEDRVHYTMPYANTLDNGALYIVSAQIKHTGLYTCVVTTVTGSISASGYLIVKGPPGEPGGVHAKQNNDSSIFHTNVDIWWQDGEDHGYPVTRYKIEYLSIFEEEWQVLRDDIPVHLTTIESHPTWHGFKVVDGLSPGNAYMFRVSAGNDQVGYGHPNQGPTQWYTVASGPPLYPPDNIGGGGGMVGQLQITWDHLPRSKWGAPNLRYIVYYKRHDENNRIQKWESSGEVTTNFFYTSVGPVYYYLLYDVKVQAINDKGEGPNSTIHQVYSAEEMPMRIPGFVSAKPINATASIITWSKIPNTREDLKGSTLAYVVNYWLEGNLRCFGKYEDTALFNTYYGDVDEGLIVGLEYGGDYCLNIQFQNHAGLGPKTDNYGMPMPLAPPQRYPEYITVMSHGTESVRLHWKAVYAAIREESLKGYKAWWWNVQENILSANITTFGLITTGVIHGIEKDKIYKLRMVAWSNGGDGQKSPDVFFTLGGQVMYDPSQADILNTAPSKSEISLAILVSFMLYVVAVVTRLSY